MPGVDEQYVKARRVLLDALEALKDHRDAVVLVGAQAIYLHTGEADIAVAPFTTDADLALDPTSLGPIPPLEQAMQDAGFMITNQPGIWESQHEHVEVDLLVPETLSEGSRGARLPGHDKMAARRVHGLEAVIIDRQLMEIAALEDSDSRHIEIAVAGPGALLVAKLHKIAERQGDPKREHPKDALDVYRLLQGCSTELLVKRFTSLQLAPLSQDITTAALDSLTALFSNQDALGNELLARAVGGLEDPEVITASCAVLAQDLLQALGK